ncbi:MAG: hypothetical protein VZR11_08495 [Succinimonas sp.]|nr:hypothetical protein [Succinimonas sp.]
MAIVARIQGLARKIFKKLLLPFLKAFPLLSFLTPLPEKLPTSPEKGLNFQGRWHFMKKCHPDSVFGSREKLI